MSRNTPTTRKRGATPKRATVPVTVPVPRTWLPAINQAVALTDSDRSKLTRAALREHLHRMGVDVPSLPAA